MILAGSGKSLSGIQGINSQANVPAIKSIVTNPDIANNRSLLTQRLLRNEVDLKLSLFTQAMIIFRRYCRPLVTLNKIFLFFTKIFTYSYTLSILYPCHCREITLHSRHIYFIVRKRGITG